MPVLDPILMQNLVAVLRAGYSVDHMAAADVMEKLYRQVRAGNELSEAVEEAIIEGRAYAATKDLVERTDAEHLPASEWIDRVHEIQFGLIRQAIDQAKDDEG